jgi:hypothetical protein
VAYHSNLPNNSLSAPPVVDSGLWMPISQHREGGEPTITTLVYTSPFLPD